MSNGAICSMSTWRNSGRMSFAKVTGIELLSLDSPRSRARHRLKHRTDLDVVQRRVTRRDKRRNSMQVCRNKVDGVLHRPSCCKAHGVAWGNRDWSQNVCGHLGKL